MTRYREQGNWNRPEREGGHAGEREGYGGRDRDNDYRDNDYGGRQQYEQTGQSYQGNYCSACGSHMGREESYGRGQQDYQRAGSEQEQGWGERDRERSSSRRGERQGGGYGSFYRGGTFAGQGQTHQRYGDSDWMGGWSGAGSDFDYGRATSRRTSRGQRGGFGGSQFESGQGPLYGSSGYGQGQFGQGQYGQSTYRGGQDYRGKGPKGYKRSDQRIKEDISEELKNSSEVDASNIEIDVKDGEITLRGEVQSRWEKRAAEECIENLPGVDDVHNQLRVRSGSSAGSENNDSQKTAAGATSSKSSQRFGTSS